MDTHEGRQCGIGNVHGLVREDVRSDDPSRWSKEASQPRLRGAYCINSNSTVSAVSTPAMNMRTLIRVQT